MTGKRGTSNPAPVSDVAAQILDPVLRRRAGITIELVQSWDEIIGHRLAERTRPEKIVWPRRMSEEDPFEPATLIIACEGAAALHVQHETTEILGRVNAFLGFKACGRIKIVQKPMPTKNERRRPVLRPLTKGEEGNIVSKVGAIEHGALRESLERLGRTIAGSRKAE